MQELLAAVLFML